jgi:hypothetical protein
MCGAPVQTPPEVPALGLRMVESHAYEIVVTRAHLAHSPTLDLYADILHEFLPIL